MKFIPALTEADQVALEAVHHKAKTHRQRQRAHAVLLVAKGFTLEQLADIFSVDRDSWLNLWQERRLDGLADAPKSGRFRKIDGSLEAVLRDILIENPSPNMKALLQTELKKRQTRLLGHCKALPQTAGDARFVDTLPTWANYQNDTSINGIWGNLVVTHTEDGYGADGYDGTIPTTILRHTNPDNLLLWKYNGLKGPGQY